MPSIIHIIVNTKFISKLRTGFKSLARFKMWFYGLGAIAIGAIVLQTGLGSIIRDYIIDLRVSLASAPTATANICGQAVKKPATYDHVIWITMENKSLGQVIGNRNAPYISSLATQCGYSTNYNDNEPRPVWSLGFHSMAHYLAGVAGSNCVTGNNRQGTGCLTDDATNPLFQTLPTVSIFEQIKKAKLTWKSYQESAEANCSLTGMGLYAARHDPVLFFPALRTDCSFNDIAIPTLTNAQNGPTGKLIDDIKNNTLPTFAYVTPNLNNDMHNGSVKLGDAWLQAYLEPLFDSVEYKKGRTAVFILWDEAPLAGQTLPNLVIAPSVHGGATTLPMNGFAVLGTTEDLLGLPHLGCATGTPPGGIGTCNSGATTNLRRVFNF
jgi:hypothetical protein